MAGTAPRPAGAPRRRGSVQFVSTRAGAALVIGVLLLLATAPRAMADPAGPTDYRTDIIGIEPDVDGIAATVIGGDSFIELTVDPGVDVMVIGYRGEDYLRFDADGAVYQNERSPSRWLNDDRFGDGTIPPEATPDAEPEWIRVADDGQFAWHDHRSHWMNEARPPAAEPGDVILEAVIPVVVSGTPVEIAVRSTWVEGPTTAAPLAAGAIAALALGVVVMARSRPGGRSRDRGDAEPRGSISGLGAAAAATAGTAALALALGVTAFVSVPSETGPSPLFWLLPGIAVLLAAGALVLGRSQPFASASLVAVAALALALWGWLRREALVRAIIPTDAPAWLDRVGIATAIAIGAVALVAAVWTAANPAAALSTPERSR